MNKFIKKMSPGLFDYDQRLEKLSQTVQPLERLDVRIDWELFRPSLQALILKKSKAPGGRPRHDLVMMFKIMVLQRYYSLSDEQAEFQINDRLSFQKFLGMTLADRVPDQKTIWLFREMLGRGDGVKKLFKSFDRHLSSKGLVGKEGKIIDASFVDVPRQRNSRDDNDKIKNNEVHYGYKDHVKVTAKTKLIDDYVVTDASVHDSQALEGLVKKGDGQLWADSAYAGEPIEEVLSKKKIEGKIHEKGYRNRPLTEDQKLLNRDKSRIRVRVEHIFGYMTNSMRDGLKMRFIGMRRITAGIGLLNLVYNMARYEQIVRLNLA